MHGVTEYEETKLYPRVRLVLFSSGFYMYIPIRDVYTRVFLGVFRNKTDDITIFHVCTCIQISLLWAYNPESGIYI